MLERHDSDGALDTACDQAEDREERQDETETFSPREHQQGFWS